MYNDDAAGESAFGFTGSWREYAPIAFTNLLLNIVTLSLYGSWANTRSRRYLWSRTRFIDDQVEYTGTGLELFIGKIIAFFLFVVPFGVLQLIMQGVLLRGHLGAAILIGISIYLLLIWLVGVAIFRALRYRLSRTWWHGIRGGSDDQGLGYGWSYFWRTVVGYLAAGLMVPWSMTTLWNRRWSVMSFGPLRFRAQADWRNIIGRYLIYYFSPMILVIVLAIVFAIMAGIGAVASGGGSSGPPGPGLVIAFVIGLIAFYLIFFVALGLVALTYYAAFFREATGKLQLGGLQFAFTARTKDWILLYLGNAGLTIATLGVGYIFVPYRNWVFFVRHAQAYGEIMLGDLTQSTTRDPGQGEGLLDAFDVGAF
ncbi:YjgN family protein [Sphingomonas sp.]|uniref:YjgN family protein n=1 Tax=Sphingomonas sp. TaxID=28214 RepID=UPI003CC64CAD